MIDFDRINSLYAQGYTPSYFTLPAKKGSPRWLLSLDALLLENTQVVYQETFAAPPLLSFVRGASTNPLDYSFGTEPAFFPVDFRVDLNYMVREDGLARYTLTGGSETPTFTSVIDDRPGGRIPQFFRWEGSAALVDRTAAVNTSLVEEARPLGTAEYAYDEYHLWSLIRVIFRPSVDLSLVLAVPYDEGKYAEVTAGAIGYLLNLGGAPGLTIAQ